MKYFKTGNAKTLLAAMLIRMTGSWKFAAHQSGLSERYCRQILTKLRTKGSRGIGWKPIQIHNANWPIAWSMRIYSECKEAAVRADKWCRENPVTCQVQHWPVIDKPLPVYGDDVM